MRKQLENELLKKADPEKSKLLAKFFKTGKGEYGEGDRFLGITVPELRQISKKYFNLVSLDDIQILLRNVYHEIRMIALFLLILKNKRADEPTKKQCFNFYLKNTKYINNWDLVDVTCRDIIGEYLLNKDKMVLYKLARSSKLWEKRISIISTFAFIKKNEIKDSLRIAEILLSDKHDLIQKAVGWTLREVGKKNLKAEEDFLKKHYSQLGRTALRYAIEKFPIKKRRFYLVEIIRH